MNILQIWITGFGYDVYDEHKSVWATFKTTNTACMWCIQHYLWVIAKVTEDRRPLLGREPTPHKLTCTKEGWSGTTRIPSDDFSLRRLLANFLVCHELLDLFFVISETNTFRQGKVVTRKSASFSDKRRSCRIAFFSILYSWQWPHKGLKKSLACLFYLFLNVKSASQILRVYLSGKEKPVREAQH